MDTVGKTVPGPYTCFLRTNSQYDDFYQYDYVEGKQIGQCLAHKTIELETTDLILKKLYKATTGKDLGDQLYSILIDSESVGHADFSGGKMDEVLVCTAPIALR